MSLKVALTGGIASGKTRVSDAFAALGVSIIDADLVAREVVAIGSEGLTQIRDYFGSELIQPNGSLDRELLRSIIFADESKRQWLNNLLHPLIRAEMDKQRQAASSPYTISVIPLLIESEQQTQYDRILVVDCPETIQRTRLMARDKSSSEQVQAILDSQASRQQRLEIADDIIDNSVQTDENLQSLQQQVINLHNKYLRLAAESTE